MECTHVTSHALFCFWSEFEYQVLKDQNRNILCFSLLNNDCIKFYELIQVSEMVVFLSYFGTVLYIMLSNCYCGK